MLDLSEFITKPSERHKPNSIIFYGPPGGGKTWLAASVSELKEYQKVLIIDTEGSTFGTLGQFEDDNIDIFPISDVESFNDLLDALTTTEHQYKAVVVDTLDVLQSMYIDKTVGVESKKDKGNTMGAWGDVRTWTISVIDRLNRADFLSIIVAHQTEEKLESGRMVSRIALSGSAKEVVAGRADIVGFVTREIQEDGSEVSTLQVGSSNKMATKNRFGLPVSITNPSMRVIMDHINKSKNKKEGAK